MLVVKSGIMFYATGPRIPSQATLVTEESEWKQAENGTGICEMEGYKGNREQ